MLASWKYRLSVFGIAVAFALLEIWLTSYYIILSVYQLDAFSWRDRISILWSTIPLFLADSTLITQVFTFLTALLVGLNITLLVYFIRKQFTLQSAVGTSGFGIFMSLLGVGCSSSGSIMLISVLGITASIKLLKALPLQGKEFSLFAITMLLVSIYLIAQKIVNPPTCKPKK